MAQDVAFQPGHNCWRVERANRLAWLIDGQAYFSALRAAAAQARHSLIIVGWDVNSRARLPAGGPADAATADFPETLLDFLKALLSRRRELRIHVLDWDFSMLYALEREWLPTYKLNWRSPRRLQFHLDDRHPVGASQHQKIVVIDDAVAFVGGLDLTKYRWDTPAHLPADPNRVEVDGQPYPPFHDVQMVLDGHAAAAIGQLARERWRQATGQILATVPGRTGDPWPTGVTPALTDVDVAIARTMPAYGGNAPVQEIKQLYLDTIAAARRHIYIENQYFTSPIIGTALARRLAEPDGPEIVMVGPLRTDGWLAQRTMDLLRTRLLHELRQHDRHRRLLACYPEIDGLAPTDCVNVHSKLAIVDDQWLILGSANLNNRSLGLDSECNVAVAANGDARIARAIASLRDQLLAEHLGRQPDDVADHLARTDSLIAVACSPGGHGRALGELDTPLSPALDQVLPDAELLDPEHPVDIERLAGQMVPKEERPSLRRRLLVLVGALAVLLGMAAAWRWSPLGEWLSVENVVSALAAFNGSALAPWLVIGGFLLGGLLVVPVTLLVTATVTVFGPLLGSVYSLAGALASAALLFGIGHRLGHGKVRRLVGSHVGRLSQRLARQGILTVVLVRLLPIAPYTVVNLVLGTSHIRLRDFLLGTALGITPGIAAISIFIDRVRDTLSEPRPASFLVLAGTLAVLVLTALGLRRWLSRRQDAVHGS